MLINREKRCDWCIALRAKKQLFHACFIRKDYQKQIHNNVILHGRTVNIFFIFNEKIN